MNQNFFTTLQEIKRNLSDSKDPNYVNITDETRKGFKEFTSFVEECLLFPGKRFYTVQYVCKYWYMQTIEIHNRYNRETGKKVSYSSTQQAVQKAALAYSKFFGIFNLYEVFDGKHNEKINELLLLCDLVIEDAESGLMPIFISEVYNYNTSKTCGKYELENCQAEIKMLKTKLKSSIYNELDNIDADKLLYLLKVMEQPLFDTKLNSVNKNKFKLLTYIKGKDYIGVGNELEQMLDDNNSSTADTFDTIGEIDEILEGNISTVETNSDEEPVTLDFDFDSEVYQPTDSINENSVVSNEIDTLQEELDLYKLKVNRLENELANSVITIESATEFIFGYIKNFKYGNADGGIVDSKNIMKATKFLSLFSKEGLDKYLSDFSAEEVEQALKNLNKIEN